MEKPGININFSTRPSLRKASHRRGKTMTKPVIDKTQILACIPYTTTDSRVGPINPPAFKPAAPPKKEQFHRRTISHEKYKKTTLYIPRHMPAGMELGLGSTRNKLNKTQFVTHGMDISFLMAAPPGVVRERSLDTTKQGKTTPRTALLSPAFTKGRFFDPVKVKKRGDRQSEWELPKKAMSTSFYSSTSGARQIYGGGNRTPVGKGVVALKDPVFSKTRTFDFSGEKTRTGSGMGKPELKQTSDLQVCKSFELTEDVSPPSSMLHQGKAFLNGKNYEQAIGCFVQALKAYPKNLDALFYKGVAELDTQNPQAAIQDLSAVLEIKANYNSSAYQLLSLAYRRTNKFDAALLAASKGVKMYPQSAEAYAGRGQLYLQLRQQDKALHDYTQAVGLNPSNGAVHLGLADCLVATGNKSAAVDEYTRTIALDPTVETQALEKRCATLYSLQKYEAALKDNQKLTELLGTDNAKLLYVKGKILNKLKARGDAVLTMEQLIGVDVEEVWSTRALYYIGKIRTKEKNFYEAYHTLNRLPKTSLEPKIASFKKLIEGIVFLIKRKTKGAVKLLTEIIDSSQLKSYYKGLACIYRAYAHMTSGVFEIALKDYAKAAGFGKKLGKTSVFNRYLCKGLLAMQKHDPETAMAAFKEAHKVSPKNREIIFYKSSAMVAGLAETLDKYPDGHPTTRACLESIKAEYDAGIKLQRNDHFLHFYRGLVLLYMKELMPALNDLDRAVRCDEEANPKYHMYRGLTYACMSLFNEGVKDLSAAIKLKDDYLLAYYNRGKCAYLLGDTDLAFMDFQKLLTLRPNDPMVHIYAGNLLMTTGSYEDAIKAFTNSYELQPLAQALYQRARCHVALSSLEDAYTDLSGLVETNQYRTLKSEEDQQSIVNDYKCLCAIRAAAKGDLSTYKRCLSVFTKLIETETTAPEPKRKSAEIHESLESGLPSEERTPPYKENIFGREDFYLYRGVVHFCCKNYKQAVLDFETTSNIKKELKTLTNVRELEEPSENASVDTDLSDVGLCAVNINEHMFNVILCLIQMGDLRTALQKCSAMMDNLPQKYLSGMWLLRGLLNEAVGSNNESEKDFENARSYDENSKRYLDKGESITLIVFPAMSRLCTLFPAIELRFPPRPILKAGLSFSFPFVKPPNMIPSADRELLREFEPLAFPCRPEPPWIKRCKYGIKFTDEIQDDDKVQVLAGEEEKYIFMKKDKYNKFKQRKCRVKLKANSDTELDTKDHLEGENKRENNDESPREITVGCTLPTEETSTDSRLSLAASRQDLSAIFLNISSSSFPPSLADLLNLQRPIQLQELVQSQKSTSNSHYSIKYNDWRGTHELVLLDLYKDSLSPEVIHLTLITTHVLTPSLSRLNIRPKPCISDIPFKCSANLASIASPLAGTYSDFFFSVAISFTSSSWARLANSSTCCSRSELCSETSANCCPAVLSSAINLSLSALSDSTASSQSLLLLTASSYPCNICSQPPSLRWSSMLSAVASLNIPSSSAFSASLRCSSLDFSLYRASKSWQLDSVSARAFCSSAFSPFVTVSARASALSRSCTVAKAFSQSFWKFLSCSSLFQTVVTP